MKVIDYKKFNTSKIVYKNPKKINDYLFAPMRYDYEGEEIPILIQTPKLNNFNDFGKILGNFIELELDRKHINFYEFINSIDDCNISVTHNKSETWFNQKLPMDVIDDFYKTNIKMTKYHTAPLVKFKLPSTGKCDIFGDDLKPISSEMVKKNSKIVSVIELQGIKFYKQKFEAEWNIIQLRAFVSNVSTKECLVKEEYFSDHEDNGETYNFNLNNNIENSNTVNKSIKKNNKENRENRDNRENIVNTDNRENIDNIENIEMNISNSKQISKTDTEEIDLENIKNTEIELNQININNDIEEYNSDNNNSENDLSDNDSTDDMEDYSDNFSDEEELCDGLEDNLQEVELMNESLEYQDKDINILIKEISELKKKNLEKDKQVNNLKNKYKSLYSELNINS